MYKILDIEEPAVPLFAAQELGHPLIADGQRVCNDFTVDELGTVILITGSNMTGKSSFLRTVGVNLRLAYAGSTVQAQTLRLAPFRLFTSIHVSDSLAEGTSYFYAEVTNALKIMQQFGLPINAPDNHHN
jgi:DNA mismatch repair ATPase MutS